MAKKQTTNKVEVEQPELKATNETQEVFVEEPTKAEVKKPKWDVKDRTYYLKSRQKPLSRSIKSTDIYYFDEEEGYQRELKYCKNQQTSFVDEMKGDQRLEHIVFRSGTLSVPKNKVTLKIIILIPSFKK